MTDVLLHIAGAVLMMAVSFLPSTPWPVAWYLAVVISAFWWLREIAQDYAKHQEFRSPALWSDWKLWEALAPTAICMLCAAGVTAARLA
jgi:hypothetical protein